MTEDNLGIWLFEKDPIHDYAFWKNAFTKEECEQIIKLGKRKELIEGTVGGKNKTKRQLRLSNIRWIFPNKETAWIFNRVTDIVLNLNERFFKFDLTGIVEGFQFTNYKAPGGKYGKHVDRGIDVGIRKLSVSIQLTDPLKYSGGELNLYYGDKETTMDKEQGTLIVFPSFSLHEVMPVTKGERDSLVTWITGKPFK